MQLYNLINKELNQNEYDQLKAYFFNELNNFHLNKIRLINFVKLSAKMSSFRIIKSQLNSLEYDLNEQAKQLIKISLLAKGDTPKDQIIAAELSEVELNMLNDKAVFTIKTKLSLLLYITMAERKEYVALKRLKALAQSLNLTQCVQILGNPENLLVNSGKLIDGIAMIAQKPPVNKIYQDSV